MERNASLLEYVSLYFEGLVKYILVCCCVFALYNFRFSLIPLFTRVITIKNDEIFILMIQSILPHSSASGILRSGIRSIVGAKLWRFILL